MLTSDRSGCFADELALTGFFASVGTCGERWAEPWTGLEGTSNGVCMAALAPPSAPSGRPGSESRHAHLNDYEDDADGCSRTTACPLQVGVPAWEASVFRRSDTRQPCLRLMAKKQAERGDGLPGKSASSARARVRIERDRSCAGGWCRWPRPRLNLQCAVEEKGMNQP